MQNAYLGGYDIGLPPDFSSQADILNDLVRQRQFQSSPNLQDTPAFGAEDSPDVLQQGTGTIQLNHNPTSMLLLGLSLSQKRTDSTNPKLLVMVLQTFLWQGLPLTLAIFWQECFAAWELTVPMERLRLGMLWGF